MYHLTPNDQAVLIIALLSLTLIFAMSTMYYILKYQKVKEQSETDSHIIAKNLTRITNQAIDLEVQRDEVKLLKQSKAEVKKAFEDAVAEIKLLKAKLSRKNQARDSHGHFIKVKPVEADFWLCTQKIYPQFFPANKYKQDKSITSSSDGLIWLFENENDLHPYLIEKKYFKPVV